MSRGLGRIQTELLGILERSGEVLNTYTLARRVYQPD